MKLLLFLCIRIFSFASFSCNVCHSPSHLGSSHTPEIRLWALDHTQIGRKAHFWISPEKLKTAADHLETTTGDKPSAFYKALQSCQNHENICDESLKNRLLKNLKEGTPRFFEEIFGANSPVWDERLFVILQKPFVNLMPQSGKWLYQGDSHFRLGKILFFFGGKEVDTDFQLYMENSSTPLSIDLSYFTNQTLSQTARAQLDTFGQFHTFTSNPKESVLMKNFSGLWMRPRESDDQGVFHGSRRIYIHKYKGVKREFTDLLMSGKPKEEVVIENNHLCLPATYTMKEGKDNLNDAFSISGGGKICLRPDGIVVSQHYRARFQIKILSMPLAQGNVSENFILQ